MSDDLLRYYENELQFIRRDAQDFAKRYPKIAGRLKLEADELEDPLTERLISAFALLNARTRKRLDDDFPEISDSMLSAMYPHYLNPVPSMSIVQFDCTGGLTEKQVVPEGTQLQTESVRDVRVLFKTSYPAELYALEITSAELKHRPFIAPAADKIQGNALLHMRLRSCVEGVPIGELGVEQLRFHLPDLSSVGPQLYELLLNHTVKIVVATESDPHPSLVPADTVCPVGFSDDEGLLPYPDNTFMGYRLVTEFFAFPEKFMFVDLVGLSEALARVQEEAVDLYFYFDDAEEELQHQVTRDSFRLGCTPVVNLFRETAEPIRLGRLTSESPLVINSRHPEAFELVSILSVDGVDGEGKETHYEGFQKQGYSGSRADARSFWHLARDPVVEGENNNELATDARLSFVDLDMKRAMMADNVITVRTLCCNRNLPAKLRFGGSLPLSAVEGGAVPVPVACISAPTPTLRSALKSGARWRLISHLNLNHLSLSNSDESLMALKEILRLYDFRDSSSTRMLIDSIDRLETRTISAPITIDNRSVLCRGTEIEVIFDPIKLGNSSVFLFASVLESFFGLYCSINSFVRVVARIKGSEEELKRWPPRAGEHQLI
jgi:type VI secretion system protein ImpG